MPRQQAIPAISSIVFWFMAARANRARRRAAEGRCAALCRRPDPPSIVRHVRSEKTMSQTIITEIRGAVAIATLNRPEALNALNTELLQRLAEQLEAWDADPKVRAIIITGSDK